MRGKIGLLLATTAILWLAFALRVWNLGAESIWHDEGWSIRAIQDPIGTPDDNTPYVYYTTMHVLWQFGIGNSPFAFRLGSVLIGLLTTAVAIRVGQQWFNPITACGLGVLVATSPLLWEYAQEVRAYVAVPLIGVLLLGFAGHVLQYPPDTDNPRWLWAAIVSVEIMGLYTHNLVVALVIWLSVAVGGVWLVRRDIKRLQIWFVLHIGMVLAYVPWLLTQSPSGTSLNTAPEPSFDLLQDIWYSYFLPVLPQVQNTTNDNVLNILAGLLFVSAVLYILRQQAVKSWLLVSYTILVPSFSTAILIAARIDFHPRYYIAAVPGTLMLLIGGISALSEALPQGRAVILGMVIVPALVISQQSLSDITSTRTYQHDDFAAVAAYYATLPSSAVILIPFDDEPALQHYFAAEYDIQAKFVNIPLYSDETTAIEQIAALVGDHPRHVEFLTWFQLPADIRGMYPCLLGANSAAISEPQTYFGLSTQRFMLNQVPDMQPIAGLQAYTVADMTRLEYMAGDVAACVRSQWTATQAVENLQVALRVFSPNYIWQITEDDSTLRTREQLTTVANDDRLAAYHFIQLPVAAPLQSYPLEMTLYSDAQPQGYDVIVNNAIVGKNLRPATPITAQGSELLNVPADTVLVSDTIPTGTIASGTSLQAEVLLVGEDRRIVLQGEDWQREHLVNRDEHDAQRVWINFSIPANASGTADLIVDDIVLRQYTIRTIERNFTTPDVETETSIRFADFAQLIGYDVNNTLDITLHWQAQNSTTIPYTVFVQLIAPDGRVIAQSDRQPANEQRPTTGWLAGEYIADNHSLSLNVDTYEGSVNVIVGFYDAQTFDRVLTSAGDDAFRLPTNLVID